MERMEYAYERRVPIGSRCRSATQRCADGPVQVRRMAPTDEELMQRVGRGDLEAFGALFERCQPSLFVFLRGLLRDEAAAEDLVQDVFWRVWEHRAGFDARRRFTTWMYVIAYRMALNVLQSSHYQTKRFSELSDKEWREIEARAVEEEEPLAAAVVSGVALHGQFEDALRTLPREQQAAFLLRENEGRSYKEIGMILGCSEGNARVIAHRARNNLRAILQPFVEDDG